MIAPSDNVETEQDIADEVLVARSINDVELVAVVFAPRHTGGMEIFRATFLAVVIHGGIAVFDATESWDRTAVKRIDSDSMVFPDSWWPTRATLRICDAGNCFT
jgi:hypothetical protein